MSKEEPLPRTVSSSPQLGKSNKIEVITSKMDFDPQVSRRQSDFSLNKKKKRLLKLKKKLDRLEKQELNAKTYAQALSLYAKSDSLQREQINRWLLEKADLIKLYSIKYDLNKKTEDAKEANSEIKEDLKYWDNLSQLKKLGNPLTSDKNTVIKIVSNKPVIRFPGNDTEGLTLPNFRLKEPQVKPLNMKKIQEIAQRIGTDSGDQFEDSIKKETIISGSEKSYIKLGYLGEVPIQPAATSKDEIQAKPNQEAADDYFNVAKEAPLDVVAFREKLPGDPTYKQQQSAARIPDKLKKTSEKDAIEGVTVARNIQELNSKIQEAEKKNLSVEENITNLIQGIRASDARFEQIIPLLRQTIMLRKTQITPAEDLLGILKDSLPKKGSLSGSAPATSEEDSLKAEIGQVQSQLITINKDILSRQAELNQIQQNIDNPSLQPAGEPTAKFVPNIEIPKEPQKKEINYKPLLWIALAAVVIYMMRRS